MAIHQSIATQKYQLLEPSFSSLKQKIEILKKINTKYVTALKQYDSKANVCLCKLKLTNNVDFFVIFDVYRL